MSVNRNITDFQGKGKLPLLNPFSTGSYTCMCRGCTTINRHVWVYVKFSVVSKGG